MLSIEGIIANTGERGRIEIDTDTGMISKLSSTTGSADIVLKEEIVFPGFVDLHVHARECADHSQDYKEDFQTAGEAAVNGGVVAFAEMPNNPVPPIDVATYGEKEKLSKKSLVEVVLYAGIGPGTRPLKRKVPYKIYMGPSVGHLFFKSLPDAEGVLKEYKGSSVSFHCEDPEIMDDNKEKPTHEERRPNKAEVSAVDFAIQMIEKYDLKGKICHSSTKEGIEKIKQARKRGVKITAEVSPHHLYFNTSMLSDKNRPWMQMNPPLRSPEDSNYLIKALKDGSIDYLATDHAPHTQEEKIKGTSGTPQLDTYGPFASWLMKEHNFTPAEIARICAENPGEFINNFTEIKHGKIQEGYAGSLAVMDLNKPIEITKEMLKTKCGWSTYEGIIFPGRVVMTIVRGKILKNEK